MIEIKNRYTGATIYTAEVATLREALERAIRDGANLYGANLDGANLYGANLYGANLSRARNVPSDVDYMKPVREDILRVLDAAPDEVPGLLQALWEGRVDGSVYHGECACLVGTIANLRKIDVDDLAEDLRPNSSRPAEKWFLRIGKGSTPLTNPSAAYVVALITHWQRERAATSLAPEVRQ